MPKNPRQGIDVTATAQILRRKTVSKQVRSKANRKPELLPKELEVTFEIPNGQARIILRAKHRHACQNCGMPDHYGLAGFFSFNSLTKEMFAELRGKRHGAKLTPLAPYRPNYEVVEVYISKPQGKGLGGAQPRIQDQQGQRQ